MCNREINSRLYQRRVCITACKNPLCMLHEDSCLSVCIKEEGTWNYSRAVTNFVCVGVGDDRNPPIRTPLPLFIKWHSHGRPTMFHAHRTNKYCTPSVPKCKVLLTFADHV